MNSTHLFNLNYFIQNVKKSKAVIILISILLPVFTFICLSLLNQEGHAVYFWELGIFNILFMYIIPVVLSICLFNYVFKKKSCDFVGGMPLSRKTIFATNTIGGIAILLLIQIVTAILSLIFSLVATNSIIFGSMIWDAFIFFTVSYIFVFVVSNLAISFSGNVFATLVSILLILFLVPFTLFYIRVNGLMGASSYQLQTDVTKSELTYFDSYNFTAPSMIFGSFFIGESYEYNNASVIKMIVLTAIYFMAGLKLFKRKRLEMSEESYENTSIHLVIKLLTLTPFVAIFCLTKAYENTIAFMFFMAVLATYYFVFDLVTNKKISLKVTVPLFFISMFAMIAIYSFVMPKLDFVTRHTIKMADVKSIRINSVNLYSNFSNDLGILVEEDDLIQEVLRDCNENYTYYNSDHSCNLTITLNNGKEVNAYTWLSDSLDKVVQKHSNEKFVFKDAEAVPLLNSATLSNEDKLNLKEKIKEDLNDISFGNYYKMISGGIENYSINLVQYKDHKLMISDYSYGDLKETAKLCVELVNKNALKNAYGAYFWNLTNNYELRKYMVKVNPDIIFEDYEDIEYDIKNTDDTIVDEYISGEEHEKLVEYSSDYDKTTDGVVDNAVSAMSPDLIIEFIKNHQEDQFSFEKPYITIQGYYISTILFYTNDIEGFYKLVAKSYNENIYPNTLYFKLNEEI